jgi:hypothetical protein
MRYKAGYGEYIGKEIGKQVEKSLAREGFTITPPLGISKSGSSNFSGIIYREVRKKRD